MRITERAESQVSDLYQSQSHHRGRVTIACFSQENAYKKREMEMATLMMDDHERGALIAALIHSDVTGFPIVTSNRTCFFCRLHERAAELFPPHRIASHRAQGGQEVGLGGGNSCRSAPCETRSPRRRASPARSPPRTRTRTRPTATWCGKVRQVSEHGFCVCVCVPPSPVTVHLSGACIEERHDWLCSLADKTTR
jgi:hypothetical protein